jgi:EAL domain-containing protein (putative c-di-GMP-specific phosphodiesterase class I)/GGDEF domain-containing protein
MSGFDKIEELRADWLKLRGYLFDPVTRLPALPAVLDEVRRRLEGGEPVGLVYLDLSGGGQIEAVHGWQIHDTMLQQVADALRDARAEVLGEHDAITLTGVRSDELVVFVGLASGTDRLERLDLLHRQLLDRVKRFLNVLSGDGDLVYPILQSASIELHIDPTIRIERTIYAALARARDLCRREAQRRQSGRLTELRRILISGDITIRYQPIIDLEHGQIHGFEALSSPPPTKIFENPEVLFAFAEETEGIIDLERLCRRQAIGRRHLLEAPGKLFINCSAHGFADPLLIEDLHHHVAAAGFTAQDVVLEVTERVAITEWRAFRRILQEVRGAGLKIAIDDMGSGYSSLRAVGEIEPDYLKFDYSLIHGVHQSPIKRDLLETLVTLARKIGAQAIGEGIETLEEFETVRSLGVPLGQGYLFARPAPPAELKPVEFPA